MEDSDSSHAVHRSPVRARPIRPCSWINRSTTVDFLQNHHDTKKPCSVFKPREQMVSSLRNADSCYVFNCMCCNFWTLSCFKTPYGITSLWLLTDYILFLVPFGFLPRFLQHGRSFILPPAKCMKWQPGYSWSLLQFGVISRFFKLFAVTSLRYKSKPKSHNMVLDKRI